MSTPFRNTILAIVLLHGAGGAEAFSFGPNSSSSIRTASVDSPCHGNRNTCLRAHDPSNSGSNRREFFNAVSNVGAAAAAAAAPLLTFGTPALLALPDPALAAAVPTAKELERLPLGLARVRYLLANWDALTSSCGTKIMSDTERKQVIRTEGGGGGFCDRTPLRVQEFLGYKSTEDPLFKADKLMLRAAPLVDPDSFEDYLALVETYREKADYGSMMAYTSSWGEANPNGSKEVIDDYLERTKDEVKSTEKLLKQVCDYLGLEDLQPLKGPL